MEPPLHRLLLVFLLLTLLPIPSLADETPEPAEDPFLRHQRYQAALEIEIGLRLFDEGDDYRAITALKRHRLLSADPAADHLTFLIIAEIYRRNAYGDLAMRHFWDAGLTGQALDPLHGITAYHLGTQELCASLRAYAGCHPYLVDLEASYRDHGHPEGAELARFHQRFVEFLLNAHADEPPSFSDPRLQRAALELEERRALLDDLPTRSPALAGVLSALLPGAGQVYNGRWTDAALAFGFTGLFAAAAVYSHFGLESLPLTILSGTLTAGFYSGNITNAIIDARRRNATLYEDFYEALHEDLWPRHTFRIIDGEVEYDFNFDWPGHATPEADPEPPPLPGML